MKMMKITKLASLSSSSEPNPFSLHFRDVEDTIRYFDEASDYPVKKFISNFEDTAGQFGWSEIHKLIFAKRSLKGIETGLQSWVQIQDALLEEFERKINSADVHQMLISRKINQ